MSQHLKDSLHYPESGRAFLEPYLPPTDLTRPTNTLPYTTITFATSLDSQLALSPGRQTVLSGPQSKAMTHYLRCRHDAILIGVGTAVADNPGLNCRIEGVGGYGGAGLVGQPRPIIVDPGARWVFTEESKIFRFVREGRGRAPFVVTSVAAPPGEQMRILEDAGGKYIRIPGSEPGDQKLDWKRILEALSAEGLRSVMIEGGGAVINSLLVPKYFSMIDSVIVTIAPTWLGQGGVVVSPQRCSEENKPVTAARLRHVKWQPLGEDVVLCGNFKD